MLTKTIGWKAISLMGIHDSKHYPNQLTCTTWTKSVKALPTMLDFRPTWTTPLQVEQALGWMQYHLLPLGQMWIHSFFRTMIQRWLRAPIYETESHCPFCDEIMDRYADHCLTCACGGDRVKRHNLLRNEVFYFCNSDNDRSGDKNEYRCVARLGETGLISHCYCA